MSDEADIKSMRSEIDAHFTEDAGVSMPTDDDVVEAVRLVETLSGAIDKNMTGDPVQMALDDLVHDAMPEEPEMASSLNNQGPFTQVAYLVAQNGLQVARQAIAQELPDLDLGGEAPAGMRR